MIAYLVGGPSDLTKLIVDEEIELLSVPSRDLDNYFPGGQRRDPPVAKEHRYRLLHHRLMDQFYIFYYEGTW